MMRKTLYFALFALVFSLTGCKDAATTAGNGLAQEFFAAWGDSAALRQVATHYRAVADSLWMPGSEMYLKRAFLETTARNDSMRAVAQVMAYDIKHYAALQSFRVFEELADEHITPDVAATLLALIDWSADLMGQPDYAAAAKAQIDRDMSQLSVERQMAVYSRVASPTMLGLSLKADREAPQADMELIDRQVRELEKLYSPEQISEFREAYGSK